MEKCPRYSFFFFFFFFLRQFYLFIYGCAGSSLLPGLGLFSSCRVRASLAVERGLQGHRLQQLRRVGSAVAVPGFLSTVSIAVVHWLSCSVTRGVFLYQESNPGLLHGRVDSLPLSHQGSPQDTVLIKKRFKSTLVKKKIKYVHMGVQIEMSMQVYTPNCSQ